MTKGWGTTDDPITTTHYRRVLIAPDRPLRTFCFRDRLYYFRAGGTFETE